MIACYIFSNLMALRLPMKKNIATKTSSEWKTPIAWPASLLASTPKGDKILMSETNLTDYPAMFLKTMDKAALLPSSPSASFEFGEDGDRSLKILKEANCIARTAGKRSYPWRYFVITDDDRKLIENTLSYRLAEKNVIENTSLIKPD